MVVDHLSRLAIMHNSHDLPINDDFPKESLMLLEDAPWYAHIANYLIIDEVPNDWKAQDRKHFFAKIHVYYWEEPFLFKYCADQIISVSLNKSNRGSSVISTKTHWRSLCLSENSHEGVAIRFQLAINFQRCSHHVQEL